MADLTESSLSPQESGGLGDEKCDRPHKVWTHCKNSSDIPEGTNGEGMSEAATGKEAQGLNSSGVLRSSQAEWERNLGLCGLHASDRPRDPQTMAVLEKLTCL